MHHRREHHRKLQLRNTGFFLVYKVMPRRRIIVVLRLFAERSLGHR